MKRILISLFCSIVFFLSVSMIVQADSVIIGPSEFLPSHEGDNYGTDGSWIRSDGGTYRTFYAPVKLPQDARITSVLLVYWDAHSGHIDFKLLRENIYTGIYQEMCAYQTAGFTGSIQSQKINPISYCRVNNDGYFYTVRFWISDGTAGGALAVKAVKILYTT